jgi:superfamily II DNA or RNA helicase
MNDLFPNDKKFRIIYDDQLNQFRLLAISNKYIDEVVSLFSDNNPASFFMKQHGYNASSKISVINCFGYFDIGLFYDVVKMIQNIFGRNSIAISKDTAVIVKKLLYPLVYHGILSENDTIDNLIIDNISSELQLRPYQENVIKAVMLLGKGRAMFECPTGSGKSFIIANLLYTIFNRSNKKLRTLIFVPNRQLVDQFYGDLLEYGFKKSDLTKFTGGLKKRDQSDTFNQIIISNRQFIFRNMHKLPKCDILICDEIHSISPDSSSYDFIENLNCLIKIACSGTIPRVKYHRWKLTGLFGPVVHVENIKTLQDQGYLSKLKIVSIQVNDSYVDKNSHLLFSLKSKKHYSEEDTSIKFNDAWNAEVDYLTNNFARLYTPILDHLSMLEGNKLMLFDRISFGTGLYDLMNSRDTGNSVWYIDGSTPVEEREKIRAHLEKTSNNMLFAQSATFSTGINIKNLPVIAFFFSGKGFSKVIQSIGRSLRLHSDKEHATLIDVSFNFKYSRRHFKERLEIYKKSYQIGSPNQIIKIDV